VIERIQSLWIGRTLSAMERLSISSFLANGHEYHLYVYEEIENAPKGTVLKPAAEILPESMIFQYKRHPSHAGFSNFFRYRLLLHKGGWWVDTDVVCLKPFDFEDPYVFASERVDGCGVPTTAVIKVPPGSEIMAFNWQLCRACRDPSDVVWGEHGPKLMARAIAKFGLQPFVKDADIFCPLAYSEWEALLLPGELSDFGENTHGIHLWNEMWRRGARDKDASYSPEFLYERLRAFFRMSSLDSFTKERQR
jgi:Glycosyltransferase sugar-binding region containing DXD motif